jgi:hypothetical protein
MLIMIQPLDGGAAARSQPVKPDVIFKQGIMVKARKPKAALAQTQEPTKPKRKYLRHDEPKSGYLTCCRCGLNKRECDFYVGERNRSGRRRRCKSCDKEVQILSRQKKTTRKKEAHESFDIWWADNADRFDGLVNEEAAQVIWQAAETRIYKGVEQDILLLERKLKHIKDLAASL